MNNSFQNGNSKISQYLNLLLALLFLMAITCTGCNPVQDGWARKYTSKEYGFAFLYPHMLVLKSERVIDRTVTLHFGKKSDSDLEMVLTMIPDLSSEEELASEANRLLSSSLYNIKSIDHEAIETVAGYGVTILEARAGGKEKILARSAALVADDKTFFITFIASEEDYDLLVEYHKRVIESLVSK